MRFSVFVPAGAVLFYGLIATMPRDAAYAQTATVPSLGAAIGQVVLDAATARGFSAADPRIAATAAAIAAQASSIASAAAAAAGEALGSVSWATVAANAGIAGLLLVPTSLGNDTLDQWQFNKDGTVTVSNGSGGGVQKWPGLTQGAAYYTIANTVSGSSPDAANQAYVQYWLGIHSGWQATAISCTTASNASISCSFTYTTPSGGGTTLSNPVSAVSNWTGGNCDSGLFYNGGCQPFLPPSGSPPPGPQSPSSAGADTPSSEQSEPLNPQVVAGVVDALWIDAAEQPGYAGLPYPVNAPVGVSDVAPAQGALGSSWPTVGSFVGPAGASTSGASGSASSPFGASAPSAASEPVATNPGSGAQVNLGPDPGIGSPSLEQTPTAAQILAPILGMLPDLRNYGMPAHTAQCPEPSITLFDSTVTVTAHCQLAEQFRPQIYVTFVLAFTLAALFIVLTA
jgi:hypothetical protein